ncbi:hypothetical protein BpHYR1_053322 [Brachionus plicatilis]|uniref:Nucleotide-diphospho-sugar transferase domain-containing protein n=1 Tax=Brachionus plicatilis TaxID=10195 RepID=A0A3M7S8N1_BRAPC|nr:hypothetical protein BpHYR1_053322 [Brachionus plicatilis]
MFEQKGNETSKLISFGLASKIFTFEQSARPSKYALMAVNIDERKKTFYFFYLPFAAQAWKRLGFQPIVLLVSTEQGDLNNFNNQNGPALKTIKYLKKLGATVKLIKSQKYYGLMTSMICRLFVGALDFLDEEDYVVTSDSDLMPIRSQYYEIKDMEAITAWNSECCGNFMHKNRSYKMYPMGHIGMKKKHWKGVMNLTSDAEIQTKTIIDLLEAFFSSNHVKKDNEIKRGDATWNADQIILSQKINIYSSDLNRTKIVQKPYQGIRLDRSQSLTTLMNLVDNKFSKLTDFHAFHSNFLKRWIVTSKLLTKMFNNETLEILFSYHTEFKNGL